MDYNLDYNLIETFIVVGEVKNLTRASQLLYKTQPTITNRIQILEDLLGYSLIIRQKGKQEIEITAKGENFLTMAQKLFSLYNELPLKDAEVSNTLEIASIASCEVPIVTDICKTLVNETHANISIYTYQTAEAYQLVAQKKVDLAFVSREENVAGIVCRPIFSQDYYVVKYDVKPGKVRTISLKSLDTKLEIYQRWHHDFELWHKRCFPNQKPGIKVDSHTVTKELLRNSEYWAVVLESCLYELKQDVPVQIYKLDDPPPQRKHYLITNRFPDKRNLKLMKRFQELLNQYQSEHSVFLHPLL